MLRNGDPIQGLDSHGEKSIPNNYIGYRMVVIPSNSSNNNYEESGKHCFERKTWWQHQNSDCKSNNIKNNNSINNQKHQSMLDMQQVSLIIFLEDTSPQLMAIVEA